jgi:hypothetical protein
VVNDIFTVEVSENELERQQHGCEIQADPLRSSFGKAGGATLLPLAADPVFAGVT